MSRFFLLVGLCLVAAGCGGGTSDRDTAPIYEAVLEHELKGQKNGEAVYLFIDGLAPSPELLDRLRQRWPALKAGPEAKQRRARRASFQELKWVGRNAAEVQCSFSNGMDGRMNRYRVGKKDGQWVVEKVELKAIS